MQLIYVKMFCYMNTQVKETAENVFVRYRFVLFVCFILAHHPLFSFSQGNNRDILL